MDHEADKELNERVRKIIGGQETLEDPMPILLLPGEERDPISQISYHILGFTGFASSRLRAYTFTDCPVTSTVVATACAY